MKILSEANYVRRYFLGPSPQDSWIAMLQNRTNEFHYRSVALTRRFRQPLKVKPTDLGGRFLHYARDNSFRAYSQVGQDLLAEFLKEGRPGYFVEFGATDGVEFSNTLMLEQSGWTGILAEPARMWHEKLAKNRRCIIDHRCVWEIDGDWLQFEEKEAGTLSTIVDYTDRDARGYAMTDTYKVETVSLNTLLADHNAPSHIDLLSVDTEGSEPRILASVDFSRYSFGLVAVEHCYKPEDRDSIYATMTAAGYRRILTDLSFHDDWYVPA